MVHSKFHYLVDRLLGRDAFVKGENGLVYHRHQHPIGNESGIIVAFDRHLAEFLRDLLDRRICSIAGRDAADHLDEFHQRNRIEKVHSDHFVRPFRNGGDLRDRDRRSVARKDRVRPADGIELLEDLLLDIEILCRGLNDQRTFFKAVKLGSCSDPAENLRLLLLGHRFLLDKAIEALRDIRKAALNELDLHVAHYDIKSGRCRLCDAVSHCSGADHADSLTHFF